MPDLRKQPRIHKHVALASPAHHGPTRPLSLIWIIANPNTLPMPDFVLFYLAHSCYLVDTTYKK